MTITMIDKAFTAHAKAMDGYMLFGHATGNRPNAVYRVTGDCQPIGEPVFTGGDQECEDYIRRLAVRAVLTAIRTPNEATLEAGRDAYGAWLEGDEPELVRPVWQAQIDSILKEGT